MPSRSPTLWIAGLLILHACVGLTFAQEIKVGPPRSPEAASDLLRPPGSGGGSDSYAPPVDWRVVPPWRQASFFGLRAEGQVFAFVVDCSGSMDDAGRMARAKIELRRSLAALRFPQRYYVVFFDDRARPMPEGYPQSADPESLARTFAWMRRIEPDGGTDPREAFDRAIGLKPDAVFFLTDGELPAGTADAVAARNADAKVPIHAVDLSGGRSTQLRRIAAESGGAYAAR